MFCSVRGKELLHIIQHVQCTYFTAIRKYQGSSYDWHVLKCLYPFRNKRGYPLCEGRLSRCDKKHTNETIGEHNICGL